MVFIFEGHIKPISYDPLKQCLYSIIIRQNATQYGNLIYFARTYAKFLKLRVFRLFKVRGWRKYTFLSENIMNSNVHQKYKIKKICDLFDVSIGYWHVQIFLNYRYVGNKVRWWRENIPLYHRISLVQMFLRNMKLRKYVIYLKYWYIYVRYWHVQILKIKKLIKINKWINKWSNAAWFGFVLRKSMYTQYACSLVFSECNF